jgi:DNA-binding CsgD family transcriptional regulator
MAPNELSDWRAHDDRADPLNSFPLYIDIQRWRGPEPCRSWLEIQREGRMNAKAIPARVALRQADMPTRDAPATSQVAMVVMLVPIPTPPAGVPQVQGEPGAPPTQIDSQDHVWLLVDKASPMAAVFEQITAAEAPAMPDNNHHQAAYNHSAWLDTPLGGPAHPEIATLGVEPLSRREIDVLRLMADGQSNQEIAQVLIVALNTVKMHIKHIYRKLGVKNRVQAVAQARGLGLLATPMH